MSLTEYRKAYRAGKREFQRCQMRGESPVLPALDEVRPERGTFRELPLGELQIPMEQVAGSAHPGRALSFARNFMPVMDEDTEFAFKWSALCDAHLTEGIQEPVTAYEYMNRYYIEEGNKRVSVLKHFGAVSVTGRVVRILPEWSEDPEVQNYYAYHRFREHTGIGTLMLSGTNAYERLLKVLADECRGTGTDRKSAGTEAGMPEQGTASAETGMSGPMPDAAAEHGDAPAEQGEPPWDDVRREAFLAFYGRFAAAYRRCGGEKLELAAGDALLAFLEIHGARHVAGLRGEELLTLLKQSWGEFRLLEKNRRIDLRLEQQQARSLLPAWLRPAGQARLRVAFLYEKTPETSAWTYAHELGRLYLEETYAGWLRTVTRTQVTAETADAVLEEVIRDGCDVVFTTTPAFTMASVRAAIRHPDVRILNCSVNTPYQNIRTYYPRLHEAKFLIGMAAASLAGNDRLLYLADYPLYGTIAGINAFAIGAGMINPEAKVYLDWYCRRGMDAAKRIRAVRPGAVSDRDMIIPAGATRHYGLYTMRKDRVRHLAMPVCSWGVFYEKLIRTISGGAWKQEERDASDRAINYWWGLAEGVVDVICSEHLPDSTRRLISFVKESVAVNAFNPFAGVLHAQDGVVQPDPSYSLRADEVLKMTWLAANVIGTLPAEEELREDARPAIRQQGVPGMSQK